MNENRNADRMDDDDEWRRSMRGPDDEDYRHHVLLQEALETIHGNASQDEVCAVALAVMRDLCASVERGPPLWDAAAADAADPALELYARASSKIDDALLDDVNAQVLLRARLLQRLSDSVVAHFTHKYLRERMLAEAAKRKTREG